MADKQFNITNNSPNYTKNNNINNINYVKRNGAGWSWFKTIFIACMLTIFSVVCFAGGKDAIPQGYTNSIRQETIKVPYGKVSVDLSQEEAFNNLTVDNIHNYIFEFVNVDNYIPYRNDNSYDRVHLISYSGYFAYLYNNILNYNGTCYLQNYIDENGNSSYRNIFISCFADKTYNNSIQFEKRNGVFINTKYPISNPFSFQLFENYGQYIINFNLFKIWLSNNFIIKNPGTIEIVDYIDYPITYATYDWNIKLTQLSKLKNVFTPLFSANIPDEEATLQKGFDQFQEFIDLGVLTYTGDKITPNRKMNENWEYNVNLSSFAKFDEMIHLLTSNLGKYINANYWYDSSTREFVKFDTNTIYGSINDTNTTLKNVINLLSYPITTGFNITYNIGVLFTFIFVW